MIKSLIVAISLLYSTTSLSQSPVQIDTVLRDLQCIPLHGASNKHDIFSRYWQQLVDGNISVDMMYQAMAKCGVYVYNDDVIRCTGGDFKLLLVTLQNKLDTYLEYVYKVD